MSMDDILLVSFTHVLSFDIYETVRENHENRQLIHNFRWNLLSKNIIDFVCDCEWNSN